MQCTKADVEQWADVSNGDVVGGADPQEAHQILCYVFKFWIMYTLSLGSIVVMFSSSSLLSRWLAAQSTSFAVVRDEKDVRSDENEDEQP